MNFENFEDYFSSNLKINDDKSFQKKLDLLLSTDKNKKELNQKAKEKKKEDELTMERKLKDEANEKKINFILSDENSFDKYEQKLKEKEDEDDYNVDNFYFQKYPKEIQNNQNEENSNITNTEYLINNENKRKDTELIKMNDDIKKNKPSLYNPKKIKKYKEMRDLKYGLENNTNDDTERQIMNKTQPKIGNSKNKVVNNTQKMKNVNKSSSSTKISKNNAKKNIIKENKKEIKKEDNDEDLITSVIQCPIQSCHKTKNKFKQRENINYIINEKNKKTYAKEINKKNENDNESLLNIYKKERQMKDKLQNIILNNNKISENDFFSEKDYSNNQFYNFDSNSKFLSKAQEMLLIDLSEEEKIFIKDIDEQIINAKKQISDINKEKNKYNKMLEERKNEILKFESEKSKEEFEYERELINDLRSVVNKFKMEVYKKELGMNNEKDNNEEDNKNENENPELKKLKDEYKELKKVLDTINKNNSKFILDIQKKIMILNYENEQMKEKIESYQQNESIENLESELNKNSNLLLNKNRKKMKMFQSDEEQNITFNKDFDTNNIIKTSSKSNHLKELDFEFPEKYFDESVEENKIIKHQFELDGKTIKIYNNNKKEIIFPNNTKKELFPDGYTIVYFSNGDIKEIIPNYKEIYYYKKDEVYQIDFSDGSRYIKYLKTGKILYNGNPIN